MRRRSATAAMAGILVVTVYIACASSTPWPGQRAQAVAPHGDAAAPARPEPAPTTLEPTSLTVLVSGDIVVHTGVWQTAQRDGALAGERGPDFRPMFASIRPDVRAADLAICRFQLPVSPPGGPYENYPVFQSPPEVIAALKAMGYDACTTAGNHNLDQGLEGIQRTVATYRSVGLPQTGMSVSAGQNRAPLFLDVKGVTVALLSYTYGVNGMQVPPGAPWCVRLIDPRRIVADAHEAKRLGAQIVIVDLHAGTEYVHAPNAEQVAVVDQITRSPDIDLVYGAHPHVTQPFAVVHGTWVAYSLGNLVAQQHRLGTYDSAMARFRFVTDGDGSWHVERAEFVPVFTTSDTPQMRVLNAGAALTSPRLAANWGPQLRASIARTRGVILSERAGAHGLTMGR